MTCPSHDSRGISRRFRATARALPLCAALMLAMPAAHAADWPGAGFLRGSFEPPAAAGSTGVRWDGINFGANFGLSSLNANFGNGTSNQIAYILRNTTIEDEGGVSRWTTLSDTSSNSRQYGGFIGYNWQMDELVLGADIAYNRFSSLDASSGDTMSRIFDTSDGFTNTVTVTSSSSLKLVDYASLRGRAGYMMGQFLPYATLGLAVGRFNYVSSATVTASGTAGGAPPDYGPSTGTDSDAKNNAFALGFSGGVGIDVALLPNVFLRGEYEFILFSPVNGVRSNLSTGRVGVGVRF
jgi:outer membrane immunogenic protein